LGQLDERSTFAAYLTDIRMILAGKWDKQV